EGLACNVPTPHACVLGGVERAGNALYVVWGLRSARPVWRRHAPSTKLLRDARHCASPDPQGTWLPSTYPRPLQVVFAPCVWSRCPSLAGLAFAPWAVARSAACAELFCNGLRKLTRKSPPRSACYASRAFVRQGSTMGRV